MAGVDYVAPATSVTFGVGGEFANGHGDTDGRREPGDTRAGSVATVAGRKLYRWRREQCERSHLSIHHGQRQWTARSVFHEFQHDLYEQQEFQPHEPFSDPHRPGD